MRLKLLFLAASLFVLAAHDSRALEHDEILGRWEGVEAKEGEELPMDLEIRRQGESLAGTFSFPRNGIRDAPLRSVSFDQGKLLAEYGPNESRFRIDATLSGDELRGEINGGRLSMEIRLSRAQPLDRPYVVEPITFTSGDVTLAGKLYRPRSGGRHPAVAIVPGSGDIAHVGHPFMADFFARLGYVCLLYDKRGTGESKGNWHEVGFWELADDANAAADALAKRDDVDPQRIGLFGYSQAGWIIPMAASRNPRLAFLVIVSGGPVTVEREGYWDVEYLLRKNGFNEADVEEALSYYRLNNHVTRTGQDYDKLTAKLREIRERPWFKLLGIIVAAPVNHSSRQWYRRVMDIDHVPIVKSLRIPVLWIYGDNDGDFPSVDAAKIVQKIKAELGNDFTIQMFPGAGHAIQVRPPQGAKLPFGLIVEEYPRAIAMWLGEKQPTR